MLEVKAGHLLVLTIMAISESAEWLVKGGNRFASQIRQPFSLLNSKIML
jgi:hypothetical protein